MGTKQSNTEDLGILFDKSKERIYDDYFTFLRFKSVSTEPHYKGQLLKCADWLVEYLQNIGFEVQIWKTAGHPVVFASYANEINDKVTLLIYHHYDVQPVDPLDEWDSPPFEPVLRGEEVFARGAQDNKGQCLYTLSALRALFERDGKYPINLKLCIEGEEEIGSSGLLGLVEKKKNELKADYLAIVDLGLKNPNIPTISLGVRGIVALEMEVLGSRVDLHSGSHGGIVYNPLHALVQLLAKLRHEDGRIAVPGFYDGVEELSDQEHQRISFDFDRESYEKVFGQATGGEQDRSPLESNWLRPTLEVNGISGGYTGDGFKTVIPSKAMAKISCRLVPGQDPKRIGALVAKFLKENSPKGVKVHVCVHEGWGQAIRTNPLSKGVEAVAKAYEEVFQKKCEFTLEGGSIPITSALSQASGAEVVFMGFGLDSDQIHAPNEHFGIDRIRKGFLTIVRTLEVLGE